MPIVACIAESDGTTSTVDFDIAIQLFSLVIILAVLLLRVACCSSPDVSNNLGQLARTE